MSKLNLVEFVKPATGIPEEKCWKIHVNGKPVQADSVDIISSMGIAARYGSSPAAPGKYAQLVLQKPGGVTVAVFCEHASEGVLIGVIGQNRRLIHPEDLDKLVLTLPGGFKDPEESAEEAAVKELRHEGGIAGVPLETRGSQLHMDRALLCYAGADFDKFYHLRVPQENLEGPVRGDLHESVWRYKTEHTPKPMPEEVEKIVGKMEFVSAEWLLDHAVDVYTYLGVVKILHTLGRINCR